MSQPNSFTLAVDHNGTTVSEDYVRKQTENPGSKSLFIANNADAKGNEMNLYNADPKPTANGPGTRRTAIKLTSVGLALPETEETGKTGFIIIDCTIRATDGVSDADLYTARRRLVALFVNEAMMVPLMSQGRI